MTNAQNGTLVLKDRTGSYFLVPQATIEQGRVAAGQEAELERLLADAAKDEVSGHVVYDQEPIYFQHGYLTNGGLWASLLEPARGREPLPPREPDQTPSRPWPV
jgi:hypothetical protein